MREEIKSTIELIQKMNKKYDFTMLEEKTTWIQRKMEEFTLKILFVGEFSAGKSALINTIIGKELLKEGQRPETAIASEIVYDTDEYIEAVSGGGKVKYAIKEAAAIDVSKYDFLIWHLDCEELKTYGECTIVDMPGFNSGIQNHNKAVLQYAGKGNAYILVIDCEEGTVKQNITEFIDEIKNYDNNMAIAVTKTDLKIEEDIEVIRNEVAVNAQMLFGENISVITTSKYDECARDKVRTLINAFDREHIFVQEFLPQAYDIGIRCVDSMETYKNSLRIDLSQFDEEIARHEKAQKELSYQLKNEKRKLENQFKGSVGPAIIADVQNALYGRVDELTDSLKAGEKSFSMSVNNILRPVLLSSTQQYVEQSFDSFIAGIDLSDADAAIQNLGANALEKYREANGKIQEIIQNSDKYNAVYKAITTTIAVATGMIAPWLELIIIFLPDVLKLFAGGGRDKALREKVQNEIIPQIVNRLRPEIEKTLMEMKEEMVLQAEDEINSLIGGEMESLEAAREKREKAGEAFRKSVDEIQKDIDEINKKLGNFS